jgi:hypothetical protein
LQGDSSHDAEEKAKIIAAHIAADASPTEPRWSVVLERKAMSRQSRDKRPSLATEPLLT